MKFIRRFLDQYFAPHFHKGGRLEKLYPLYEAADTFLFTPADKTKGSVHLRDQIDLKRMMSFVVIALMPCVLFGMYNVGYQANSVLSGMDYSLEGWRYQVLQFLGIGFDPASIIGNFIHGALYFVPIYLVTNVVGGFWEVLFSIVRKHEVNEGMFVTGFLFPLILPPTIPLWQVAVGISFGIVVGKEVFGGTGKNFLNPALLARAFLFFAYPGEISGELVWTAVDGYSGATALAQAASGGVNAISYSMSDAFWGFMPGSIGETSVFACLLGAAILIISGVGSWRIMVSIVISTVFFSFLLFSLGSSTNPMFSVGPFWHLLLGGFAFGTVFMATDPVSAAATLKGQYIYGALIGMMVILIRVINPAFPEGMMLAIIFGNVLAPLIDYFVVEAHIKRRERRYAR